MPTPDHFSLIRHDHPRPPELREKPRERVAPMRRILKRGLLIALVTVLGFGVLSVEGTAKFLVDLTASFVGGSARQLPISQSLQVSQPAPDSADVTIAGYEKVGGESATAEAVAEIPRDIPEPTSEILFRQFQAWAAEEDAQRAARAQSVQDSPALQPAPARAVEDTTASIGRAPKDRHVQRIPSVRPQLARQDSQKEIRQPQNAGVQVAPTRATERRIPATKPSGS
jgi:hypothetical protein